MYIYTHRDRERVVHVCMSTRVYAYTYARSALARTMQHLVAGSPRLLRARATQWARLCAKSLATQLLELRAAIPNSKACLPWAAVLEHVFVDMFRVAGATGARCRDNTINVHSASNQLASSSRLGVSGLRHKCNY